MLAADALLLAGCSLGIWLTARHCTALLLAQIDVAALLCHAMLLLRCWHCCSGQATGPVTLMAV